MVDMQMETFCLKHKTKMSIFYQLNMFKILRYFTKHSRSMLKYRTYFKYVSTHSVSSETYNQMFRTKTYNKKKSVNKIRGREIEKRKRDDHP